METNNRLTKKGKKRLRIPPSQHFVQYSGTAKSWCFIHSVLVKTNSLNAHFSFPWCSGLSKPTDNFSGPLKCPFSFKEVKKWSEMKSLSRVCNPMDYSLPGFSIHGIFQARILEWLAIFFSRGCSQPRNRTQVSRVVGRRFHHLSHQGSPWKF